jgi:hypothetical protein
MKSQAKGPATLRPEHDHQDAKLMLTMYAALAVLLFIASLAIVP